MYTVDEIITMIETEYIRLNSKNKRFAIRAFMENHPDVTSMLNEKYNMNGDVTFQEMCYCFCHGMDSVPLCSCGKRLEYMGPAKGFRQYCSPECRYKDKEAQKHAAKVRAETNRRKFGVDNVFLLNDFQEKARETRKRIYGDPFYSNHEQAMKTMMSRYGCSHPGSSREVREKIRETMRSRYGVESAFGSEVFREKSRNTMKIRYGVPYAAQNKDVYAKVEATNMDRYGSKCVFGNDAVREKSRMSMKSHYGVENYSKTREYHLKRRHAYVSRFDPSVSLSSTWEILVYDYCRERGVVPVIAPCSLQYRVGDDVRLYFPDFMINGHLVEVKGDQYINKEGDGWINPYRPGKSSRFTQEYIDEMYKEKGKCAARNGVIVLGRSEIENLDCSVGPLLRTSGNAKVPMPLMNTHGLSADDVIGMCRVFGFPGTGRWPKDHPIWRCNVKGRISPYDAWNDQDMLRKAVSNMFRYLDVACAKGREIPFIVAHESAFKMAAEGDCSALMRKVLNRFTVARIAPKVTAFPSSLFTSEIKMSGIDISSGVYCPMAGFGGIVEGARRWMSDHGLDPETNVYASDINKALCSWYGWDNRDVLSERVETDMVVVACPPFSDTEQWPGTPVEMYRPFEDWCNAIREHVKAPRYVFFGPVTDLDRSRPDLFLRCRQARFYPEFSRPIGS